MLASITGTSRGGSKEGLSVGGVRVYTFRQGS
jgi:hypothetical protein